MNIIDAQVEDGKVMIDGVAVADATQTNGPIKFGIRPEHMTPDENGPLRVNVQMTEPLGANTLLHGRLQGHQDSFTISLPGVHSQPDTSKTMCFAVQPGQSHIFDSKTGLRIPSKMPEATDSEFCL